MTWTHDARHLVTQAHYDGDLVLSQTHDDGYRLTQQSFGNDLTRDITYNRADNQRTSDIVKNGNTPIAISLITLSQCDVCHGLVQISQSDK